MIRSCRRSVTLHGTLFHLRRRNDVWIDFVRAVIAALVAMYLSGYIFFRAIKFEPTLAFACAPIYSIGSYAWLSVIYYELGIRCSIATVAIPPFAIGCLAFVLARRDRMRSKKTMAQHLRTEVTQSSIGFPTMEPFRLFGRSWNFDTIMLCAYIFVGIAICLYVFVLSMPHPDAFYSRYDNMTHINAARAFLESGKWSSLHESAFLASAPSQTPTGNNTGGFYPSAWHALAALIALISHVDVTIAANALVAVVCGVCFPMGIYALLRALLPHNRLALQLGAFAASGSAVLPWVFVIKGPTWPEMLAHAFVPVALATVVLFVEQGMVRRHLPAFAVFAGISFAALALMHPNSFFTAYVFLAAYGLHTIARVTKEKGWHVAARVVIALAYCSLIVAFWIFCYHLPIFKSVLSYKWTDDGSLLRALMNLCSLGLGIAEEQPVLMASLLVGGIVALSKGRGWLLFAPLFFAVCFVVCRINLRPLMYWLAAMWYETPYRFASKIILFCMPLFALGLSTIVTDIVVFTKRLLPQAPEPLAPALVACVLMALLALNYTPETPYNITLSKSSADEADAQNFAAFGRVHYKISQQLSDDIEQVYSASEITFVNKALALIPEGALVINYPIDGSMWAYGVNGMNTLYRSKHTGNNTEASLAIRARLCDYATDIDVQNAVRNLDAQYVLLLDKNVSYEDGVWLPQTHKNAMKDWQGIANVDDSTPGFELVLAEGSEMRLYRIVRSE